MSRILFPMLSCWALKSHGIYPNVRGSGPVSAGTGEAWREELSPLRMLGWTGFRQGGSGDKQDP